MPRFSIPNAAKAALARVSEWAGRRSDSQSAARAISAAYGQLRPTGYDRVGDFLQSLESLSARPAGLSRLERIPDAELGKRLRRAGLTPQVASSAVANWRKAIALVRQAQGIDPPVDPSAFAVRVLAEVESENAAFLRRKGGNPDEPEFVKFLEFQRRLNSLPQERSRELLGVLTNPRFQPRLHALARAALPGVNPEPKLALMRHSLAVMLAPSRSFGRVSKPLVGLKRKEEESGAQAARGAGRRRRRGFVPPEIARNRRLSDPLNLLALASYYPEHTPQNSRREYPAGLRPLFEASTEAVEEMVASVIFSRLPSPRDSSEAKEAFHAVFEDASRHGIAPRQLRAPLEELREKYSRFPQSRSRYRIEAALAAYEVALSEMRR